MIKMTFESPKWSTLTILMFLSNVQLFKTKMMDFFADKVGQHEMGSMYYMGLVVQGHDI